jgi:hypothetical protein
MPNFAIERALTAIAAQGLFKTDVVRVGVIGPGLDFADKRGGHDFYPVQSIQPFAVLDALRRLELTDALRVGLWVFDLSPRIVSHLQSARRRAERGDPYRLVLLRDPTLPWRQEVLEYWVQLGERVGRTVATAIPPPQAGPVDVKGVHVRPDAVLSITSQALDIVVESARFQASGEAFDLIIGTNVLTYYDPFQQSLALLNIAAMLRPGGLFLSNDPIVVLPAVPLVAVGSTTVRYTELPNSRDEVAWYQR